MNKKTVTSVWPIQKNFQPVYMKSRSSADGGNREREILSKQA